MKSVDITNLDKVALLTNRIVTELSIYGVNIPISAGSTDEIHTFGTLLHGSDIAEVYVLVKNPHYGYFGVETYHIDFPYTAKAGKTDLLNYKPKYVKINGKCCLYQYSQDIEYVCGKNDPFELDNIILLNKILEVLG